MPRLCRRHACSCAPSLTQSQRARLEQLQNQPEVVKRAICDVGRNLIRMVQHNERFDAAVAARQTAGNAAGPQVAALLGPRIDPMVVQRARCILQMLIDVRQKAQRSAAKEAAAAAAAAAALAAAAAA